MTVARSYKVEREGIGSWKCWQEVQLRFLVVLFPLPSAPVGHKDRTLLNMKTVSQDSHGGHEPSSAVLQWNTLQTPLKISKLPKYAAKERGA